MVKFLYWYQLERVMLEVQKDVDELNFIWQVFAIKFMVQNVFHLQINIGFVEFVTFSLK